VAAEVEMRRVGERRDGLGGDVVDQWNSLIDDGVGIFANFVGLSGYCVDDSHDVLSLCELAAASNLQKNHNV
jgi:hypothetical protein